MGTPILRSTPSFSSHFDDAHYVDQLSSNHYFYPKFQGCMSREKNSADFQELYVMIRYMNYSCSLLTALQYITHSSYYSNILQLVIISQNVEYFFLQIKSCLSARTSSLSSSSSCTTTKDSLLTISRFLLYEKLQRNA